jgi:imidazolonepropionase-like amidohydrolase
MQVTPLFRAGQWASLVAGLAALVISSEARDLLWMAPGPSGQPPRFARDDSGATALAHVTVIDGTGAPPRPDRTLLLQGGRIAAELPSDSAEVPAGAELMDLHGRWVIPGLIDTHVHLATDPSAGDRRELVVQRLRNALHGGVTTVRDMAGDGRALAELSRAALVGDIESPAIYYAALAAGPAFFTDERVLAVSRGLEPGTAPWARAVTAKTDWPQMVAEARGTGARAIKVYADVAAPVLRPLVREAHRQGLLVWAHAALFPARPSEVVEAGVDVVSHASLLAWEGADHLPGINQRRRIEPPPVSDPRIRRLIGEMKRRGTLLDATLFVMGDAPPPIRRWSAEVTRAAWAAGVPVSAGTDSIGVDAPGTMPNVHEELRLLVEAGLPPLAAISAGTRNGARAIGIEADRGTIAPGKAADLVVLSADPVADIRHTRDIVVVFRNGIRYEPLSPSSR